MTTRDLNTRSLLLLAQAGDHVCAVRFSSHRQETARALNTESALLFAQASHMRREFENTLKTMGIIGSGNKSLAHGTVASIEDLNACS